MRNPAYKILVSAAASMLLFACKPGRVVTGKSKKKDTVATVRKLDSLDIKIGQMVMVGIEERTMIDPNDSLLAELRDGKMGGVVLFEKNIAKTNSADSFRNMTRAMQQAALIPIFVTIDEEGGKVHRLKEKYGFVGMPSASYLGGIDNPDSTLFYNRRLAAEMHDLGINLNYAPCVDVAVNPENPVIVKNGRSFSADPEIVTKHALLCIQAHHENSLRTILKHFPGHGSSANDSHLGIADVTNTWKFIELEPYKNIIESGEVDAIMTAHIINRAFDTLPATLSKKIISDKLRGFLRYDGVVFSDDMQMHAIAENFGFENAIALSINAGVDVVMFANTIPNLQGRLSASKVHAIIKNHVANGTIKKERIDEAYRRIMDLKKKKF
ncbi:glycoside hydrolase family 3 protein [Polluticoccus soli]|uniref:glycoside hydrolase family 3 protein n=1 Tax=Polluticoccus soli TaxID=3034150 RepID=UPI0023E0AE41|nr:glycoside hydrolase family 3 N-terminal domain-containing protein [Flavipsychrobacter sp. JY13-12]